MHLYAIKYLAENDRERFEQIVTEKMKSLGLDYDDALSEVIADGCELMLRDTNAPALLARENPSLLQKGDELQKRYDAALAAAVQNRENARSENENARSENNSAAPEGGKVQYSSVQTFLQADIDTLRSIRASHPGSGRISIFDFSSQDIKKAEKWARQFYSEMGTKSPFFRRWFGEWRANDSSY